MFTHMHLWWIFPLYFGTDPAPPWTILPSCSPGKGRFSQQCAGRQQLVGSALCSQSAEMGAQLGAGRGHGLWRRSASKSYASFGAVGLCAAPQLNPLCSSAPSSWKQEVLGDWSIQQIAFLNMPGTAPSLLHQETVTICFLPYMVQKPFFGLKRFSVLGACAIQRWELKRAFPFLGRRNGILGVSNILILLSLQNTTEPSLLVRH